MKLLFRYLSSMRLLLTAGLSIKMLSTLIELVIPYILSHILDNVVPSESISAILLWGGAMILCAGAALAGNTIANRIAAKTSRNMTEAVRHDLFQKTMSLSCRTADRFTIPSLEARLTSDTYNLHNMVGMMQRIGVRAPLLLIGGLIVTLVLDARLALIMIAALPIMVLVILFVSKCGIPMYSGVQERVDGMVRVVREDAQGIRVIKALSKKDLERRRFDSANRALIRAERNVSFVMSLSNPVMQLFLNLGLVAVVLFGAYLVNDGISQPGKIIGFQQYFTLISMAMLTMTRIFIAFSKGIASAERIREVLDSENELVLRSEKDFPRRVTDDHVRFEKVTFSYGG
ncbi:MAG: ABC transporter ATP-binding protein, partial [Clostridia bacterium]|nr:ABC transporter ATP-binding protein [Clostridia bacterium]